MEELQEGVIIICTKMYNTNTSYSITNTSITISNTVKVIET